MFTGIIEGMGVVKRMTLRGVDVLLELETDMDVKSLRAGDSVCVNGACLTVTSFSERGFTADVSAETLSRTNLGSLKAGDRVSCGEPLPLWKRTIGFSCPESLRPVRDPEAPIRAVLGPQDDAFTPEALEVFKSKVNVRILQIDLPPGGDRPWDQGRNAIDMKRIGSGILLQTADNHVLQR
ncbi:MAG TPA: hypothetical protein P5573_07330, partial [Syntrophales bacterium]|nr:hypothetical protein [Syntrophales bacterium]